MGISLIIIKISSYKDIYIYIKVRVSIYGDYLFKNIKFYVVLPFQKYKILYKCISQITFSKI